MVVFARQPRRAAGGPARANAGTSSSVEAGSGRGPRLGGERHRDANEVSTPERRIARTTPSLRLVQQRSVVGPERQSPVTRAVRTDVTPAGIIHERIRQNAQHVATSGLSQRQDISHWIQNVHGLP